MIRTLALAVLVAGCRLGFEEAATDPDAFVDVAPPPDFTSGTRLRAIVYESGGEVISRSGWFDKQLGEECTVQRGDDGGRYCFPNRIGHFAQFSDPACTVPLMRLRTLDDTATCPSAAQLGYVETAPRSAIYRLGQVGAQYGGVIYQNAGGPTCDMLPGNDGSYYSVASYLPLSQLVGFTEEVLPAGPLGYIRNVADDGSSEIDALHLVDMASGERCDVQENLAGRAECALGLVNGFRAYADASCTVSAVATFDQPDAAIVRVHKSDPCGDTPLDVTVGAPLSVYYVRDTTGCMMRTTNSTSRAWVVAEEKPANIPLAGMLTLHGNAPIARGRWTFSTGHSLPTLLVDRARNDHCFPINLRDTFELVCAPLWTSPPTALYSDAACTQGLFAYPTCAAPWRSTWYPGAMLQETCVGTSVSHFVRTYDVPVAAPTYWYDDGVCTPVASDVTVYTQSATDYPASSMKTLTFRRE